MGNKLDLIGTLRDFCQEKNIFFIAGPEDYRNAVADYSVYAPYELILICDFTFSPAFTDNALDSVTYNGTIALGRKRESETVSSLDETFEQKYDNRLAELSELLVNLMLELKCKYDIDFDYVRASYSINQYDLNCDFVSSEVQMTV